MPVETDAPSPPVPHGYARTLLTLRHALVDPLSSAALKLDLVARRLASATGAEPSWTAERLRAAHAEVGEANRLLDLLLRLAEIVAERPAEASIPEVCRLAGVPLAEPAPEAARLHLRRRSCADAIQRLASLARRDDLSLPAARAAFENGRVFVEVEATAATADRRPERLLELPHGAPEGEALFLARAAVEADGGALELSEREGRIVARLSWPLDGRIA